MERRVVITGLGAITPIGNNVNEFWDGIKQGKCGIDEIKNFDTTNFKVKLAGEVKGFNPDEIFGRREARRMDRFSQFAVVATREAWNDSGLDKEKEDMTRVGVIIGSGIGGLETIEKDNKNYIEKGPDRVSPMYIPMSIGNMAAGNVAIDIGAKGESISMVTACASGTHCIGESFRMIKHGYQDIVIAGGTEASITPTGIAGFTNIKALTLATDKNRASIPFDKERSGFVMGEGAGVLVLCNVAVTIAFYILLKKLNTPNLIFSTISVVTSFFAASLTMLRSSYYALGYASNDIVLIILWILASIKDPGYIPVVVNFLIFILNDMYGFICWKKRETAQC